MRRIDDIDKKPNQEKRTLTSLLPKFLQSSTSLTNFFSSSIDHLIQPVEQEKVAGYIGRRPSYYNPADDFYVPEINQTRENYQLEAVAISKKENNITNALFYQDLLDQLRFQGALTENQNRLFEQDYYSWCPPIDLDMLLNYSQYYWFEEGIPEIVINDITNLDRYVVGHKTVDDNDPVFGNNGKIKLTNGLRIKPTRDINPEYNNKVWIVEGIGKKIFLVEDDYVKEITPWDMMPWDSIAWDLLDSTQVDYVVMERGAKNKNPWSIANHWYHKDVLLQAGVSLFASTDRQAKRPIICFLRDLELYNYGTQRRGAVDIVCYNTLDLSQVENFRPDSNQKCVLVSVNGEIRLVCGEDYLYQLNQLYLSYGSENVYVLRNGTKVLFNNLKDETRNNRIYMVRTDNTTTYQDTNRWDLRTWDHSYWVSYEEGSIFEYKDLITGPVRFELVEDNEEGTGDPLHGDILSVSFGKFGNKELWYNSDVGEWIIAQAKTRSILAQPLFQLYDADPIDGNGVRLDDPIRYPGSTFKGNKIFGYRLDNDTRNPIDKVLQTRVKKTQWGEFEYQNYLVQIFDDSDDTQYSYFIDDYTEKKIPGYYFWRVLPNNNIGTEGYYSNNWYKSEQSSKQYIIDSFITNDEQVLEHYQEFVAQDNQTDYTVLVQPKSKEHLRVVVNDQNVDFDLDGSTFRLFNSVEPGLVIKAYVYRNKKSYLEFDLSQEPDSFSTRDISVKINGVYANPGIHYVIDTIPETSEQRRLILLQSEDPNNRNFAPNTNIQVKIYSSKGELKGEGFYEVPVNLTTNPDWQEFAYISKEQFLDHFKDLLGLQEGFRGNPMGANNWRDTERKRNLGRSILQHTSPLLKLMVLNSSDDLDFLKAARYVQTEYNRFKNKFLNKLNEFYNKGRFTATDVVNGVEQSFEYTPREALDILMNHLNLGKVYGEFPFSYSGMAGQNWFIPPTPSYLGLYPVHKPGKFINDTYAKPIEMLQGHDGFVMMAYGDFRDDVILELENLIYDSIHWKFKQDGKEDPVYGFEYKKHIPGKFRQHLTDYTREEFNTILQPNFERWCVLNGKAYRTHKNFDHSNAWSWNYSSVTDKDGETLPGYWRGIYFWYFDTDRPHSHPWEMLGFSEKPQWWEDEYGPAPYTEGNTKLWEDLEKGYIRQGNRQGIDEYYARPGLRKILPVDESGKLLNPYECGIVKQRPHWKSAKADWAFGDGGPVENVWRRSDQYPFALVQAAYLMKPARFIEQCWDPSKDRFIYKEQDGQGQLTREDTLNRHPHNEYIVHGEIQDNTPVRNFGFQQWITDRLLSQGKDISLSFGEKIRGASVQLGYKIGGFANKYTVFTESGNLLPDENSQQFLYTSPSKREEFYGGVIIEWTGQGWAVWGYDVLNPSFTVIPGNKFGPKRKVVVGGKSTKRPPEWKTQVQYRSGDIVLYNTNFYKATVDHLSSNKFDPTKWVSTTLPESYDGLVVNEYLDSNPTRESQNIAYGTVFDNPEDVYNFLVGYQRYLETRGWIFDEIDVNNNIRDFRLSGREFLHWAQNKWEPGTILTLSPFAEKVKFATNWGTVRSIESIINGVYSILDQDGYLIEPSETRVTRNGDVVTVESNNPDKGIYSLRLFVSETEHVLLFDNYTIFGDVTYNPIFNQRHDRLKVIGYRTRNWRGRYEAPGFLITGNGLTANFEKSADNFLKLYGIEDATSEDNLRDHARHLVGYQPRAYLNRLLLSPLSQFEFYQGMLQQKGSLDSMTKLFRSEYVTETKNIKIYEEWAFRVGNYGAVNIRPSMEFYFDSLSKKQIKEDPQLIRFETKNIEEGLPKEPSDNDDRFDNIITFYDYIDEDKNIVARDKRWLRHPHNETSESSIWDTRTLGKHEGDLPNAGPIVPDEVHYHVKDEGELLDLATNERYNNKILRDGERIWIYNTESGNWTVYRVTKASSSTARVESVLENTPADQDALCGKPISDIVVNIPNQRLSLNTPHLLNEGDYFVIQPISTTSVSGSGNVLGTFKAEQGTKDTLVTFTNENVEESYWDQSYAPEIVTFFDLRFKDEHLLDNNGVKREPATGWKPKTTQHTFNLINLLSGAYKLFSVEEISGSTIKSVNGISIDTQYQTSLDVFVYINDDNTVSIGNANNPASIIAFDNRPNTLTITVENNVYDLIYVDNLEDQGWATLYPKQNQALTYYYDFGTIGTTFDEGEYNETTITNQDISRVDLQLEGEFTSVETITDTISVVPQDQGTLLVSSNASLTVESANPEYNITLASNKVGYVDEIVVAVDEAFNVPNATFVVLRENGTTEAELLFAYDFNSSIEDQTGVNLTETGQFTFIIPNIALDNNHIITDYSNIVCRFMFEGDVPTTGQVRIDVRIKPFIQIKSNDVVLETVLIQEILESNRKYYYSLQSNVDSITIGAVHLGSSGGQLKATTTSWNKAWTDWKEQFSILRREQPKIDTSKIENAIIYDLEKKTIVTYLSLYDPYKGIVPGIAEKEIHYKLPNDPAKYTHGSDSANIDPEQAWGPNELGRVWWDLSTTRVLDYELEKGQDKFENDLYCWKNWGSLAPGTSVDIYEWVRSPVPPTEISSDSAGQTTYTDWFSGQLNGTPKNEDNPSWVERIEYDETVGEYKTYYYFWMKNKAVVPNAEFRSMSVTNVANIITNPSSYNVPWFAPVSENAIIVGGVKDIPVNENLVVQINWRIGSNDGNIHRQWILQREGDPTDDIDSRLWQKMCDSLVGWDNYYLPEVRNEKGQLLQQARNISKKVPDDTLTILERYGTEFRPRQSWFKEEKDGRPSRAARRAWVTGFNKLLASYDKPFVDEHYDFVEALNVFEPEPAQRSRNILENEILYYDINVTKSVSVQGLLVRIDVDVEQEFDDGYLKITVGSEQPINIDLTTKEVHTFTEEYNFLQGGIVQISYESAGATVGKVTVKVHVIENNYLGWDYRVGPTDEGLYGLEARDLLLSDPGLHKGDRVLVTEDHTVDNFWTLWQWNGQGFDLVDIQKYRVDVDRNEFLYYADWYLNDNEILVNKDTKPLYYYTTYADLIADTFNKWAPGALVQVNDSGGKWAWYIKTDDNTWKLCAREKGTVQLSDKFWQNSTTLFAPAYMDFKEWTIDYNTITKRDGSRELKEIINKLFEQKSEELVFLKNKMFFKMVNHAHTEHDVVDWAFKTSYIYVSGFEESLRQKPVLEDDRLEVVLDYINEVKPYHTKLREFIRSVRTSTDISNWLVTDFDKPPAWDAFVPGNSTLGNFELTEPYDEKEVEGRSALQANRPWAEWWSIFGSYYSNPSQPTLDTYLNNVRKGKITLVFDRIESGSIIENGVEVNPVTLETTTLSKYTSLLDPTQDETNRETWHQALLDLPFVVRGDQRVTFEEQGEPRYKFVTELSAAARILKYESLASEYWEEYRSLISGADYRGTVIDGGVFVHPDIVDFQHNRWDTHAFDELGWDAVEYTEKRKPLGIARALISVSNTGLMVNDELTSGQYVLVDKLKHGVVKRIVVDIKSAFATYGNSVTVGTLDNPAAYTNLDDEQLRKQQQIEIVVQDEIHNENGVDIVVNFNLDIENEPIEDKIEITVFLDHAVEEELYTATIDFDSNIDLEKGIALGKVSGVVQWYEVNVITPFDDPRAKISIGTSNAIDYIVKFGKIDLTKKAKIRHLAKQEQFRDPVYVNVYGDLQNSTQGQVRITLAVKKVELELSDPGSLEPYYDLEIDGSTLNNLKETVVVSKAFDSTENVITLGDFFRLNGAIIEPQGTNLEDVIKEINNANLLDIYAEKTTDNKLVIKHVQGGSITIEALQGTILTDLGIEAKVYENEYVDLDTDKDYSIEVDGGALIQPHIEDNHPEELIHTNVTDPGTVLTVYERGTTGAPSVYSHRFVGNGTSGPYSLRSITPTIDAVFVFMDGKLLLEYTNDMDASYANEICYRVNWNENAINFCSVDSSGNATEYVITDDNEVLITSFSAYNSEILEFNVFKYPEDVVLTTNSDTLDKEAILVMVNGYAVQQDAYTLSKINGANHVILDEQRVSVQTGDWVSVVLFADKVYTTINHQVIKLSTMPVNNLLASVSNAVVPEDSSVLVYRNGVGLLPPTTYYFEDQGVYTVGAPEKVNTINKANINEYINVWINNVKTPVDRLLIHPAASNGDIADEIFIEGYTNETTIEFTHCGIWASVIPTDAVWMFVNGVPYYDFKVVGQQIYFINQDTKPQTGDIVDVRLYNAPVRRKVIKKFSTVDGTIVFENNQYLIKDESVQNFKYNDQLIILKNGILTNNDDAYSYIDPNTNQTILSLGISKQDENDDIEVWLLDEEFNNQLEIHLTDMVSTDDKVEITVEDGNDYYIESGQVYLTNQVEVNNDIFEIIVFSNNNKLGVRTDVFDGNEQGVYKLSQIPSSQDSLIAVVDKYNDNKDGFVQTQIDYDYEIRDEGVFVIFNESHIHRQTTVHAWGDETGENSDGIEDIELPTPSWDMQGWDGDIIENHDRVWITSFSNAAQPNVAMKLYQTDNQWLNKTLYDRPGWESTDWAEIRWDENEIPARSYWNAIRVGNAHKTYLYKDITPSSKVIEVVANPEIPLNELPNKILEEPTNTKPGVVWINNERIEYWDIEYTVAEDGYTPLMKLKDIRRGTFGTGTGVEAYAHTQAGAVSYYIQRVVTQDLVNPSIVPLDLEAIKSNIVVKKYLYSGNKVVEEKILGEEDYTISNNKVVLVEQLENSPYRVQKITDVRTVVWNQTDDFVTIKNFFRYEPEDIKSFKINDVEYDINSLADFVVDTNDAYIGWYSSKDLTVKPEMFTTEETFTVEVEYEVGDLLPIMFIEAYDQISWNDYSSISQYKAGTPENKWRDGQVVINGNHYIPGGYNILESKEGLAKSDSTLSKYLSQSPGTIN